MRLERNKKIPYAQVANHVLGDPKLSWKAKGIYAYLFSKPETWDFSTHRIKNDATDGMRALGGGIKELEKAGYLQRIRQSNGRVKYVIYHSEPDAQNATVAKRHSGKTHTVSNIDRISNTDKTSNTENQGATRKGKPLFTSLGADILKAFEGVDPKNKTYYSNTTQRGACDFLIAEYGFDKVVAAIKMLPQINQQKLYIRQITTPHELKENWVKIGNAVRQKASEQQIKKEKYKVAF